MDDRAVSAVVGFIFMVLIAITFIGIVQSVMLPEWNKGVEVDHSLKLSYDTAKIGEAISFSSATGKPTLVSLNPALSYPKRPFLISPTFASATISAVKQNISIKSDKINYDGITYAILLSPNYHYSPKPKFLYEHSATFKSYDGESVVNSKQSSFTSSSINIYILNSTITSLAVNGPVNLIFEPISYGGKTLIKSGWINFTVSNETVEWWNKTLSEIYGANNVSVNGNWINVSVTDVYLSLSYLIVQASTSQSKAEISASRQAVELVNLSNPPSEVYKGVSIPLGVKAIDKFYNPVPDTEVEILINSNLAATKRTDDNGEVWYYFEANATGNYNIEFKIPADSYTYSLSVISTSAAGGVFDISWNATPSGDIFVDDWNVSLEGSEKQYKVTVTYEGNPVSDARIDLSTDSPSLVSIPAESVTDTSGESTVSITALDNGTANVIAASAGSSAILRLFITGVGGVGSVCPAGWGYWREITIQNNVDYDLTNYQISITLDTQSLISDGKMRNDCGDIRFYDENWTTSLNYWVEEGTCDTSNTVIWVKVPSIPASGQTKINMLYGNSSAASESDIDSTFQDGTLYYTRQSTSDPNSLSDGVSSFYSATDNSGYCQKMVSDFTFIANHYPNGCGGSSQNIAFWIEAFFYADRGGRWEFRYGPDFGRGGGIYIDGAKIEDGWNEDLWWSYNWNAQDVLEGYENLQRGWHKLFVIGYEGCCDGGQSLEFKKPGDSWKAWSTSNLNIKSRKLAIPEPTISVGPERQC